MSQNIEKKPENMFLSIIVPVYNEAGAIAELHQKIIAACAALAKPFEVIFINDGSSDTTAAILKTLSPLTTITFRRNFGQTAALDAGIKAAHGTCIATLDGDGQNDPADIPRLLAALEEGDYDVMCGWRKDRKDPFSKKISSRAAAVVRKFLINDGIHDSGCTLRVCKRECFDHIDLYGEMHRFIPALLVMKGFKIGEVPVKHFSRTTGVTKYNWRRGVKGNLDMLSVWFWKKYANRPLHIFGSAGLLITAIAMISGAIVLYNKIFFGFDLSDTALTTLSLLSFFFGIQLFIFGIMADILSKTYFSTSRDTAYEIKEVAEQ